MSDGSLVSVVALLGWLALMIASYRSYKVDTSQTVRMALIWACIFVAVAFVFSLVK
ncbi:MAG: hypothetical protein KDE15_01950 [Erythrobacter sp.]|nr:hypothetical protein [Erythrobacter sp.]